MICLSDYSTFFRRLLLRALIPVLSLAAIGVAQQSPGTAPADTPQSVRIGVGDMLDVAIFDTPELSGKVRVNNLGVVSLPLIGSVAVSGLSVEQAQALIAARLADGNFVTHPQVMISVTDYGVQSITIVGEVKKPGTYPPVGATHLLDLISRAEGLTPLASHTVFIYRKNAPDHPLRVKLSDNPEQAAATNLEALPGDTVMVGKAGIVYVVGDVGRPGGFPMEADSLSVLQAVALAAGPNRTAKMEDSRIIRKNAGGVDDIPVHLSKLMKAQGADIPLQPGDILFVPSSAVKSAVRSSALTIMQTAAFAALYLH